MSGTQPKPVIDDLFTNDPNVIKEFVELQQKLDDKKTANKSETEKLKKNTPFCILCGGIKDLTTFDAGKGFQLMYICTTCQDNLITE